MNRIAFAASIAVILLSGCGGGSSTESAPTGKVHETRIGEGTITYFGQSLPAQTYTVSGVSLAAMAGANFTNLTMNPAPTLSNSVITYILGNQVWVYRSGVSTQITNSLSPKSFPSASKTGKIAFTGNDSSGKQQIFSCNFDGSGVTPITTGSLAPDQAGWSPSGAKLVFFSGVTGHAFTINANGTGLTDLNVITNNAVWSPDGTKLAFAAIVGPHIQIYTMPATGGALTAISNDYSTRDCFQPAWSPDGTAIAFSVEDGTGKAQIVAEDSSGGTAHSKSPSSARPAPTTSIRPIHPTETL